MVKKRGVYWLCVIADQSAAAIPAVLRRLHRKTELQELSPAARRIQGVKFPGYVCCNSSHCLQCILSHLS